MQKVVTGEYARGCAKMGFTEASKRVLGAEEALRLRNAYWRTTYEWFGDYLHDVHPEIFTRLTTYMKVTGEW